MDPSEDLTAEEQALFDDLARRARHLGPEDLALEAPPDDLWDDIVARTTAAGASASGSTAGRAAASGVTAGDAAAPMGDTAGASVTPLRRPSRARLAVVVGVAAASALIAGVLTWSVVSRDDDRTGGGTVVATAELEALTEDAGPGRAELVDDDGELRLRVDVADPGVPGEDAYLEVWVIDPDVAELVSLGPIRPDGTYDLPAGIDPEAFPIVDVSREPFNGDPTHSGDSTVRGQLTF